MIERHIQKIAWRKYEDGYLDLRPIQEPNLSLGLTLKISSDLMNLFYNAFQEVPTMCFYMKGPAEDVRLYCRS